MSQALREGLRPAQECAARAVCPTPFGNRDSNWLGTATGPKTITVTYSATVKDKYSAYVPGSPATIDTTTAKYELTLHDAIEKVDETLDGSIRRNADLVKAQSLMEMICVMRVG